MRANLTHNIAHVRQALDLTQKDLARLTGRSPATIQAIELGRLPLSPALAAVIAEKTGADATWLMESNCSVPFFPKRSPIDIELEQFL